MLFQPFPMDYDPATAYEVAGLMPWRLNTIARNNVLQSAPLGAEQYGERSGLPHGGFLPLGADDTTAAATPFVLGGATLLIVLTVGLMAWNARNDYA